MTNSSNDLSPSPLSPKSVCDSPTYERSPKLTRFHISVTERIHEFLKEFSLVFYQPTVLDMVKNDTIDMDELVRMVVEYNKMPTEKRRGKEYTVRELLAGSQTVKRESPSMKEQFEGMTEIEMMRLRAAERKYQKSIRDLSFSKKKAATNDVDFFSEYKTVFSAAANAILGIVLTFLGGYWLTEIAGFPQMITKVSVGMCLTFITIIIEVILFITYDKKRELKAKKDTRKKQIREKCEEEIFKQASAVKKKQ